MIATLTIPIGGTRGAALNAARAAATLAEDDRDLRRLARFANALRYAVKAERERRRQGVKTAA